MALLPCLAKLGLITRMLARKAFRTYLLQNDLKSSTIKNHFYYLGKVYDHLSKHHGAFKCKDKRSFERMIFTDEGIKECEELVLNYLDELKSRGCRNSHINKYIASIRIYYKFLDRDGGEVFKFLPKETYIKATMSDKEIEAFLRLPPPTVVATHRNGKKFEREIDPNGYHLWTLFFSIMAFTGMRPGEVAHLTVDTVDFGRSVFILEDTKTGYPRLVPIPPNICNLVMQRTREVGSGYLFPARRGSKSKVYSSVQWGYNFHARVKRLGIKRKNLTPYSLRHSLITRLLEEDVAISKVMKLAGHTDIRTTHQYTHITTKDVQQAVKKHPIIRRSTSPREIMSSIVQVFNEFRFDEDTRFEYNLNAASDSLELSLKIKH